MGARLALLLRGFSAFRLNRSRAGVVAPLRASYGNASVPKDRTRRYKRTSQKPFLTNQRGSVSFRPSNPGIFSISSKCAHARAKKKNKACYPRVGSSGPERGARRSARCAVARGRGRCRALGEMGFGGADCRASTTCAGGFFETHFLGLPVTKSERVAKD